MVDLRSIAFMAQITHISQDIFAIYPIFVAPHFRFSKNQNRISLAFLKKIPRFCLTTVEDELEHILILYLLAHASRLLGHKCLIQRGLHMGVQISGHPFITLRVCLVLKCHHFIDPTIHFKNILKFKYAVILILFLYKNLIYISHTPTPKPERLQHIS